MELEELLDVAMVDLPRVLPVEFGERLGGRERRVAEAALVVPALALDLLGLDESLQPGLVADLRRARGGRSCAGFGAKR